MLKDLEPPPGTLCVLPELWATGFAYADLDRLKDSLDVLDEKLLSLAKKFNIILAGSSPESIEGTNGRYYNALKIVDSTGYYKPSRKMNLFPSEEISFERFLRSPEIVVTAGGCFGAFVCYDLRFPEISSSLAQQGADLLICSAQWPAARIQHWRSLLIARAIENQIFIIGCNSVGQNNGTELGGHSMVVSPNGKIMLELEEKSKASFTAIHWSEMQKCRESFRSFTTSTRSLSVDKIFTPGSCAKSVVRRSLVGQKVVIIQLQTVYFFAEDVVKIENKRQECDFLVIAFNCEESTDNKKEEIVNDSDLRRYAALSAVDAVVDLQGMSKELVTQLFDNHIFTIL